MAKWTRREFLALSASTVVSAYASAADWKHSREFYAAIVGWDQRSQLVADAFRGMQNVRVSAVAGVSPGSLTRHKTLLPTLPGTQPALYPDVSSMLRDHVVDFLYASRGSLELADWPGHLLIDGAVDSRAYDEGHGRCVQVLPQYEFAGCGRSSTTLSGDWTKANIDCRGSLPDVPLVNREELARWLYREVGEAVDFTREMMGVDQPVQIFSAAAPAASPYEARLGWRMVETGSHGKSIEVSMHATQSKEAPTGIQIRLSADRRSVTFRAAPRSMRLTQLLTANLLDAMTNGTPDRLIYRPRELSLVHDLLSKAAATLVA